MNGTGAEGENSGRVPDNRAAEAADGLLPEGFPADPPRVIAGAEPTIYDVARVAGVAASTVSRALSKPGRVSFRTAERVRGAAEQLGYRSGRLERAVSSRGSGMLAMIVADIANPVFFGMIRGAEQTATENGFTLLVVETQESEQTERAAATRLASVLDGTILSSSRVPDAAIRALAKEGLPGGQAGRSESVPRHPQRQGVVRILGHPAMTDAAAVGGLSTYDSPYAYPGPRGRLAP